MDDMTKWQRLVAPLLAMDAGKFDERKVRRGGNPENKGQFSERRGAGGGMEKAPKPPKPKSERAPADVGAHAEALQGAGPDREKFDRALARVARMKKAEVKQIADLFMGYSVKAGTKESIVKQMRNWQREAELNDDIHAAQAKINP